MFETIKTGVPKVTPTRLILILLIGLFSYHSSSSQVNFGHTKRIKSNTSKIAVCYYMSSLKNKYPCKAIRYENLTHIAHAFIWPAEDGSLKMDSSLLYPELIYTAHLHGVKVIISLGGWGRDKGFGPMAANFQSRKKFVKNLTNFCLVNGYDGADIDWEYPSKADRENFVKLVTELRQAFDRVNLEILTAALPAKDYRGGYDIEGLKDKLSWFGIMTYDFHGAWTNHMGYNSPLYSSGKDSCGSVDNSVQYYLGKGVPKEKLLIGMAFYGRVFDAQDINKPCIGGDAVSYTFSKKKISEGWSYNWDDIAKVPYLKDPAFNHVITFDDPASIRLKCEYIRKMHLRGAIVWALNHDYDGKQQPMLDALGEGLLADELFMALNLR